MARRRAADNVSMHAWFVTALLVVALAASSCASSGARPQPFPMPPGPENPAADIPDRPPGVDVPLSHPDGFAIASAALRLQGIPYRSGGADPQGFDCSGLVQYVLARYGLSVPRVVRDQYAVGTRGTARRGRTRRSGVLHDRRPARLARRHRDRWRSLRPRTECARYGAHRQPGDGILGRTRHWCATRELRSANYAARCGRSACRRTRASRRLAR